MGVKDVYREERVSSKSGRLYQVIVLVFENGYKFEAFLNDEQQFILNQIPLRKKN